MAPHIRTKPAPFASRGARHGPIFSSRSAARLGALLIVLVFVIGLLRAGDSAKEGHTDGATGSNDLLQELGSDKVSPESATERRYPPPAAPRKLSEGPIPPIVVPDGGVDPDPRWNHFAVAVRSPFDAINASLPFMYAAWLSGIKHAVIVGDKNLERVAGTNLSMIDLASDVAEVAMRVNAGGMAVDNEPMTTDDDSEDDLDEALGTDSLSQYLKNAEKVARESGPNTQNSRKRKGSRESKQETQESAYYRLRRMHKRGTVSPNHRVSTSQESADHPNPQPDHEFHLSTVRTLYQRFPHADWYLLVDHNTHVFMENLHHALFSMDPSKPIYVGLPTMSASKCQGVGKRTATLMGQLQYASFATGIIISRGAVEQLAPLADQCIIKYQGCATGDVRLGLCMKQANVTLGLNTSLSRSDLFQTLEADWTSISFADDACLRPISIANATPASFELLSALAGTIRASVQQQSDSVPSGIDPWSKVSPSTHPWLYAPGSDSLVAQSSPHYSPVTMADLLRSIMVTTESRSALAPVIKDSARPSRTEYDVDRSVVSLDACRTSCVTDKACRSWEFDIKALTCRRFKGIPASEKRPLAFSGVMTGRYTCQSRLW